MRIASKLACLTSALALVLGLAACSTMPLPEKQSVVIQISENDPAKWNLALNNAKNLQSELGKDNVNIEIVAYGPGLDMLKFDSEVANRLTDARKSGVTLAACGNTMKARKVAKDDLHADVTVVPAGVVEIMGRQRAGWTYIKP